MEVVSVREFSRTPGGRVPADGPANGEEFRESKLVPALSRGTVRVLFDDVAGLPVSFLEEAFGGLVRNHAFTAKALSQSMEIVALKPKFERYVELTWRFIRDAEQSNTPSTPN